MIARRDTLQLTKLCCDSTTSMQGSVLILYLDPQRFRMEPEQP